jgi:hypothetical protein
VDLPSQFVGLGRQNRARLDRLALPVPGFPQANEGKRASVTQPNVEGLFRLAAGLLPLVEAVGQHQTMAVLEGGPERRLGRRRIEAGVDRPVTDLGIVGPAWH